MSILSRRGLLACAAGVVATPGLLRAEGAPAPAAPVRRRAPARPRVAASPPAPPPPPVPPPHAVTGVSPDVAMERLMAGNARYAASQAARPHGDAATRVAVATAERPFASVLACADSRVAPEIVFDQGLGDLFVVRVAGPIVDDAVLASLEYSVIHLGSRLIMVLGHERCGAVKAAAETLDGHPSAGDVDTRFGALIAWIAPALKAVPAETADRLDAAASLNATRAAAEIFAGSRPLRDRVLSGDLKIVAARYDLDSGLVTPARGVGA